MNRPEIASILREISAIEYARKSSSATLPNDTGLLAAIRDISHVIRMKLDHGANHAPAFFLLLEDGHRGPVELMRGEYNNRFEMLVDWLEGLIHPGSMASFARANLPASAS